MRKLRIAQVSPLFESVPPKQYGGTERIVSYLTEELVSQGHDVTLFASGDSVTAARLVSPKQTAIRLDHDCRDWIPYHLLMLEQVIERAEEFDLIHFHMDLLHLPFARRLAAPSVTTLHGRLDLPDLSPLYREFRDAPLVSISFSQRKPLPFANWVGNVYHGLPLELYRASTQQKQGQYLAFLGRISREKGPDMAIALAKASGLLLKIAAKVDRADQEYFDSVIRPLLDDPLVEFVGEVNDKEKEAFCQNAIALLFPIDWPEPFGLVMIEAMACGTPVIARKRGSVPEIIDDGITGFIFETQEEALRIIERAQSFDRARCRNVFEERFSTPRMARDYLQLYEQVLEGPASGPRLQVWNASEPLPLSQSV